MQEKLAVVLAAGWRTAPEPLEFLHGAINGMVWSGHLCWSDITSAGIRERHRRGAQVASRQSVVFCVGSSAVHVPGERAHFQDKK